MVWVPGAQADGEIFSRQEVGEGDALVAPQEIINDGGEPVGSPRSGLPGRARRFRRLPRVASGVAVAHGEQHARQGNVRVELTAKWLSNPSAAVGGPADSAPGFEVVASRSSSTGRPSMSGDRDSQRNKWPSRSTSRPLVAVCGRQPEGRHEIQATGTRSCKTIFSDVRQNPFHHRGLDLRHGPGLASIFARSSFSRLAPSRTPVAARNWERSSFPVCHQLDACQCEMFAIDKGAHEAHAATLPTR